MRSLYRFYLYTVFILLSIYATYACTQLLSTLLRLTPLHASSETQPSSSDLVQTGTFALVSFAVVLLIGGFHYWLIRRDIAQDAKAGTSAIRSFFLNTTEGIAAALSLPTLGAILLGLASLNYDDASLAFALATLALALLLELERRRIASPLVRGVFFRVHIYGVQAILLIVLGVNWSRVVLPIVDALFFGGRAYAETCSDNNYCSHDNLFLLAIAGLWFAVVWLFYGWLTSRDSSRFLRFIFHGLGFAVGISLLLAGLYSVFNVILLALFREPVALSVVLGTSARYNFVGLLTLGLLVAFMYHTWMRAGVHRGLLPIRASLPYIELAGISVLTAVTFWWGIGNLLYNTFVLLLRFPQAADRGSWLSAGSFALAGCVSIAIEFYLQRKNRSQPELAAGPRRAQVFALLAIGILTLSIAIATTLYIGLTTVLRSPITNWTQVLSFGLATLLVGLILAGFYLYTALNEHQFSHTTGAMPALEQEEPDPSQHAEYAAIEAILGQLLANQLTRAEASDKLHKLMHITGPHEIYPPKSDSVL